MREIVTRELVKELTDEPLLVNERVVFDVAPQQSYSQWLGFRELTGRVYECTPDLVTVKLAPHDMLVVLARRVGAKVPRQLIRGQTNWYDLDAYAILQAERAAVERRRDSYTGA